MAVWYFKYINWNVFEHWWYFYWHLVPESSQVEQQHRQSKNEFLFNFDIINCVCVCFFSFCTFTCIWWKSNFHGIVLISTREDKSIIITGKQKLIHAPKCVMLALVNLLLHVVRSGEEQVCKMYQDWDQDDCIKYWLFTLITWLFRCEISYPAYLSVDVCLFYFEYMLLQVQYDGVEFS